VCRGYETRCSLDGTLPGEKGKVVLATVFGDVHDIGIRERRFGAEHPDTANGLNNLAGLYVN